MNPLWSHQHKALHRAGSRFALFFDPGCGKSRTAIEIYKKSQFGKLGRGKAIIFAPLNVCRNWENELKQYLGAPYKTFLVAGQSKLKKVDILEEFKVAVADRHVFLICNIESLRALAYLEPLCESGARFVIVDESHNFKSPNSAQTKGLIELEKKLHPDNLLLLTGTPAPQGEIDLWSTFYLMKKTADPFFVWRKKYFADLNEARRGTRNYWPNYTVTKSSKELFQRWLSECSAVAKKNEVLDLPPLLRTNIYAEMSPEQSRHYETMKDYLFAIDSDGNELNAANMLSRTLRLQQILAGFLGDIPVKENLRLQALDAAIERTAGGQFIVWTIFKSTYAQIADRLDRDGITFGMLTGNESAEERAGFMSAFQNGEIRALIAHPKAGGVGVNLTAAAYSIHYTRSYSLTDDLQCEARNYRGGSEIHERITRIDIITPDTIDEDIVTALREKKSVQDFILGLKQQHKEAA